jgi:hypothetical protein
MHGAGNGLARSDSGIDIRFEPLKLQVVEVPLRWICRPRKDLSRT